MNNLIDNFILFINLFFLNRHLVATFIIMEKILLQIQVLAIICISCNTIRV